MKLQPRRCGTCKYCDRESYKAVKTVVCYNISEREGKGQAVTVKETQQACGRYRAVD